MISLNRVVYALFGKSLGCVFRDQSRSIVNYIWKNYCVCHLRRRINSKYRSIMRIPRTWLLRMHSISPVPKSKNLCLRLRPRLRKILCSVGLRLCTKPRDVRLPLRGTQHNRYHDLVPSTVPVHIVHKRPLILTKWTSIRLNSILPESPFWVGCACAWPNYRTRVLSMYHPLQFPTFHAMTNKNPSETNTNEWQRYSLKWTTSATFATKLTSVKSLLAVPFPFRSTARKNPVNVCRLRSR